MGTGNDTVPADILAAAEAAVRRYPVCIDFDGVLLIFGLHQWEVDEIEFVAGKPDAYVFIDDKGFRFEGRFPDADEIRGLKQWDKPEARTASAALRDHMGMGEVVCPECVWEGAEADLEVHMKENLCPECRIVLVQR